MEPSEEKTHYQTLNSRRSREIIMNGVTTRSTAEYPDESLGSLLDDATARLRFIVDAADVQLNSISHLDSLASFADSQISQIQNDVQSLSGSLSQMQQSQLSEQSSTSNISYDTSYSPGMPLGTLQPSSDMATLRPLMYAAGHDNGNNWDTDVLITDTDSTSDINNNYNMHGPDDSLDTGDSMEHSSLQTPNAVDTESFDIIPNDLNMEFVNTQRGNYSSQRHYNPDLFADLDLETASDLGSFMQVSNPSVIGSDESPLISVSESDHWGDTEIAIRQAIDAAIGIPMTGPDTAIIPVVMDYWDSLDIAEIAQNWEEEPNEFDEYINI